MKRVERHRLIVIRHMVITLMLVCLPAWASSKKAPLPESLVTAKSIYLVNKTGNQQVLDTAYDQFSKWGRFTIAKSKDAADIIAVFTHESGLDEGTTVGFTQMAIFVKDSEEPAYEITEHYKSKLFGQSSTKSCVNEFKKRLEQKD